MKPLDRNISILEHIVSYCQQIEQTVASDQGTVDPETTWEIITDDIPALKKYCEAIIQPQEIS